MEWTSFDRNDLDRSNVALPGEARNRTVTPFFRYENVYNEPQSRIQGKPVFDLKEMVEIRFAANPTYKPVMGVDEMAETNPDTGQIITWAERYKPQYQAFLAGSEQEAEGTPLEELLPYGISQAQLSYCRAMSVYSIEALAHIEGVARKRMGMHGNDLIPMAKRYLDARRDGSIQQTEINELKRQLAELRAVQMSGMGEAVVLSTEIPEEVPILPAGFDNLTDAQIKDEIERLTDARPRGNPSRTTLEGLLTQALAA